MLVDEEGVVRAKSYRLSQGNPVQDAVEIASELYEQAGRACARLEIQGAATTGYAKDVLARVKRADMALVETVAHARSGVAECGEVDVIIDVGGQDIKLVALQDGHVKDFMLNTQCSAGNGYFLQATAQALGVPLKDFAARAFTATRMPQAERRAIQVGDRLQPRSASPLRSALRRLSAISWFNRSTASSCAILA